MNIFIIIAFILGGGVIAFDKLVHELPQWLAICLYSGAVVLFIVGMIVSKKS